MCGGGGGARGGGGMMAIKRERKRQNQSCRIKTLEETGVGIKGAGGG